MNSQNKIIIQKGYEGREKLPFINNGFKITYKENLSLTDINTPVIGSVKFCEQILTNTKPCFYPDWAEPLYKRKISKDINHVPGKKHFIKDFTSYKSKYSSLVTHEEFSHIPEENSIYSEVIDIKNEYRHYFLNGKELCNWWYDGKDILHSESQPNMPSIKLNSIPKDFCGTIDMAQLENNDYVLIEVHKHPYAIGWYGEEDSHYIDFIVNGWQTMLSNL